MPSVAIIGQGRLGNALAVALRKSEVAVHGPLGRDAVPAMPALPDSGIGAALGASIDSSLGADLDAVLLCVPDDAVPVVARALAPRLPAHVVLAHCSGALTLDAIDGRADHQHALAAAGTHHQLPHAPRELFSLHPLLSVTRDTTSFAGASCAIAWRGDRAQHICHVLVAALEMHAVRVDDALRPLYHAAAAVASGYLLTVLQFAESLMAQAGVDRAHLAPLVDVTVANWRRSGAAALTGPVARGDTVTVAMHRAAIAGSLPGALPLWEALTHATAALAHSGLIAPHPGSARTTTATPAASPDA